MKEIEQNSFWSLDKWIFVSFCDFSQMNSIWSLEEKQTYRKIPKRISRKKTFWSKFIFELNQLNRRFIKKFNEYENSKDFLKTINVFIDSFPSYSITPEIEYLSIEVNHFHFDKGKNESDQRLIDAKDKGWKLDINSNLFLFVESIDRSVENSLFDLKKNNFQWCSSVSKEAKRD